MQFEILQKIQVYTFIVASEKKNTRGGGCNSKSYKNPGIDFYSGFRKKIQVYTFIVTSEKKNTRGGAIRNPKKSRYRLL